jgi:predicted ATPase/DNA-binding XRE family transcriptional regulator
MVNSFEEIALHQSIVREQWLPLDVAVQEVVAFEKLFGTGHFLLACHAALPSLLTPELLHSIRLNFLDQQKPRTPWIAEMDFLLSPLCRPLEKDLFEVEPMVREVLLFRLEERYGWQQLQAVSALLLQYILKNHAKKQDAGVTQLHEWIAQAYLQPDKIVQELVHLLNESVDARSSDSQTLPKKLRIACSMELLAGPLRHTTLHEEYTGLIRSARVLAYTLYGDKETFPTTISSRKFTSEGRSPLFPLAVQEWLSTFTTAQKNVDVQILDSRNGVEKVDLSDNAGSSHVSRRSVSIVDHEDSDASSERTQVGRIKKYSPNNFLRKERERRNWSYADVAEQIGLPDSHSVSRWERGEVFPRLHYRRELCRIFGKSMAELGLIKSQTSDLQEEHLAWKIPPLAVPLIGREQDIGEVCALLQRPEVRLVTLLGVGGIGKTSLAFSVAQEMRPHFPDGGYFISLASITDPALVLPTCAKELGLQESRSLSIVGQLAATLRDRRVLLVLDNFEQVGPAAKDVEDLLAACPDLKILITSRAVLHLQIEHGFYVAPLEFPDFAQHMTVEELLRYPSIALFVESVRTMLPDFPITENNLQTIAEICVRLNGLPLAIELAAPRMKTLSPQHLLQQLPGRFEVLKSVLQVLPERQNTFAKNMTWSYDLLSTDEKWLFRRLAVFLGGGTLSTIEELFSERTDRSLDILSILSSLVDQNMVQRQEVNESGIRFIMSETVRDYGLDDLRQQGEFEEVRRTHARHYLALAEEGKTHFRGPQQAEWLTILDAELGNLRSALQWCIEQKEGELALRFCDSFGNFCGLRGYWSEERRLLQVVLDLPEASAPTAIRARVLRRAGHLAYRLRDMSTAHAWFAESVKLSRQFGDLYNLVGALSGLGRVQYRERDISSARTSLEESVLVARAYGDTWALANALESLGDFIYDQGDVVRARTLLEESITLLRTLGDKESLSRGLRTLVSIELASNRLSQADSLAKESFQLANELGTKPLIALALDSLVDVALFRGNHERALGLVNERIALAQALGDTSTILKKRLILGEIAVEQGDPSWVFDLVQESLRFFRQQADRPNMAVALGILGDIELAGEDLEQALIFYKEALFLYMETGNKKNVAKHLIRLAKWFKMRGQVGGVAPILNTAEVWQNPLSTALRTEYDKMVEWLRTQMDETEFGEMLSKERAMTLEQLLSLLASDIPIK